MRTILVVVDENETTAHVLPDAVERAERERASLVVLNVMPQSVYEGRQRGVRGNRVLQGDGVTYTFDQATATARGVAERAARVAIGDRAVPYTSVGVVGRPVTAVLAVAEACGCDEIVIAGTETGWFGRSGRFDRTLAKRFGGRVTRVGTPTHESPELVPPVPEL